MTEEAIVETTKLGHFCEQCELEILVGDKSDDITFKSVLVNRPGLLLAGFEDYFSNARVQVIGNAEHYYLASLQPAEKKKALTKLFVQRIP
ncbi:MAG: HPr kinase/phosphorylase, partial [Clostridia bacterium]|nr:HPr kinase/phosphorylase [Clostridia bacterium]